jgi:hypothetical protein
MKSQLIRWLAIVAIIEIGLLHIMNAQAEYEEAAYMGYLFAANFFGALVAAWGIQHRQMWGWILGLFIAAGSIAGYAWSRTLGMPDMNVEEWYNPYGIVALALEGVFMLLFFLRSRLPEDTTRAAPTPAALRVISPVMGLILIGAVGFLTYQWNFDVTLAYGHHVGSLGEVCDTPLTSLAELEQEYGVQVSLVADSMMSSIVDVRLKIVDPEKAYAFLQNQAALLVGQQALILAPHMHSHNTTRLKTGKIFSVYFSTEQIVHPGSEVSLVFGPVRVAPVVVQ